MKPENASVLRLEDSDDVPKVEDQERLSYCRRAPLIIDLVHNNARSRFLLMMVYAFVVSIVTFYFVVSVFVNVNKSEVRFVYASAPQVSSHFGSTFKNFSVVITNQYGIGLSGAKVTVTMYPIQAYTLTARMADGSTVSGRTVDCIKYLLNPNTKYAEEDRFICSPASAGVIENNVAWTDSSGTALFSEMRLNFGIPAAYALVIQHDQSQVATDTNANYLQSTVTMNSRIYTIEPLTTLPQSLTVGSSFSATAKVTLANVDTTTDQVGDFFGVSDSEITETSLVSAARIRGMLISFDPYQATVSAGLPVVPATRSGSMVESDIGVALVANNMAPLSGVSQLSSGGVSATITFPNATVSGAMKSVHYFAVLITGFVAIFGGSDASFQSASMYPKQILVPASIATGVRNLTVIPPASFTGKVQEGSKFSFKVTVLDASGAPLRGKKVFAEATPFNMTDCVGGAAKALSGTISGASDAAGSASFDSLQFSTRGCLGVYRIAFVCDGVTMTYAAINGTTFSASQLLVEVNSSVATVAVEEYSARWLNTTQTIATVGQNWVLVPTVRVFNAAGKPITGKYAAVSAFNTTGFGVVSESLSSNDVGWISFKQVMIVSAAAQGNYSFQITVDGVPAQTLVNRTVIQRTLSSSCASVTFACSSGSDCTQVASNVPLPLVIAVRDQFGQLLPSATVEVNVTGMSLRAASNSSTTATTGPVAIVANATGFAFLSAYVFTGAQDRRLATISVGCASRAFPAAAFSIVVVPRLSNIVSVSTAAQLTSTTYQVTVTVNQSFVAGACALPVSLSVKWQPLYVTEYYASSVIATSTFMLLNTATVALPQLSFTADTPGIFAVVVDVDGTVHPQVVFVVRSTTLSSMTLVSSIGSGTNTTIGFPFSSQPSVMLRDSLGNPVSGMRVYAEIGILRSNGQKDYLSPFSNSTDFGIAMLINFVGDVWPLSALSNSAGLARFFTLGVIGAVTSNRYVVRYTCVPPALFYNSALGGVALTSLFVEDTAVLTFADSETVTMQIAGLTSLYAIPGVTLSTSLRVLVMRSTVVPLVGALGQPVVYNTSDVRLVTSDFYNPSVLGVLDMGNIAFSESTPEGTYALAAVVPGGVSSPTSKITVTRAAFRIDILTQLPTNIIVGCGFDVDVLVRIPTGGGLPNAVVTAVLVSANQTCISTSCGVLASSTSTSITDSEGHGHFYLVVEAAQEYDYTLQFTVAGTGASVIDKLNGFASGASQALSGISMFSSEALEYTATYGSDYVTASQTDSVSSSVTQASQIPTFLSAQIKAQKGSSAFATLASSIIYRQLKQATDVTATTDTLHVWNNVARVEILKQPALSAIDSNVLIASNSNLDATFNVMPILHIVDTQGRPLSNKHVTVVMTPSDMQISFDSTVSSNAAGLYTFHDLKVVKAPSGNYQMLFIVDGVCSNYTQWITVSEINVSISALVQLVAVLVIIIMSPLFYASIPFSHWAWFVVSLVVLGVTVIISVTWVRDNVINNNNWYLRLHVSLMAFLLAVLTIGHLVMLLIWAYGRKVPFFRFFDDEQRMLDCYEYTKWLVNVRRPQLSQEEWEAEILEKKKTEWWYNVKKKCRMCCNKIKTLKDEVTADKNNNNNGPSLVKPSIQDDDLDGLDDRADANIYEAYTFQPPPIEVPSELRPIKFPTKFIIVFSITIVLMIVVTYLVVYWISVMSRWLDNVAAYIPRPPTLTSDEEKQLNKELQSAIVFSFNLIAANTAKLDFLRTLEPQVRSLNFFKLWHDVFTWIHELKIVVEQSAFWGLSFGLFAVVATWVGLYFATSRIMQEIRQGKLRKMKEETSLIVADRYVGLHCMHFVVTFVSVFFIVFVIAVLLSSPKLLMEILKNTYKALLTSLATVIISTLFEKLVVGVWWVNGLTIFLMHPYFLWTVISVIMSLVNGVIETIVRWFEAIFSITVLFARLDMDLFPKALLWLDMGYWAYYSMLFVDEEYNNPIFLTAASCFLTELLIHREFKAGVQSKPTQFGGAEVIQLPHIRNILRIRLRAMMGESTDLSEKCRSDSYAWDLHLMDAVSLRKRRVANRWRLAMTLVMNPSLVKYRKYRTETTEETKRKRFMPPAEQRAAMLENRFHPLGFIENIGSALFRPAVEVRRFSEPVLVADVSSPGAPSAPTEPIHPVREGVVQQIGAVMTSIPTHLMGLFDRNDNNTQQQQQQQQQHQYPPHGV